MKKKTNNRNHQFKQRHERDGDKCKHFDKRSKQLKYELLYTYIGVRVHKYTHEPIFLTAFDC